jgi:hypothetical protein
MTPTNTNIEKTAIGMQYAIPGNERPITQQRYLYKADSNGHFETWVRP